MRILYDHQVFSWQKYGGISRYFYEIITRISRKNANIDLFKGFNINEYPLNKENINGNYISYKRVLIPKTGFIYNALNLLILNKKHTKIKYDVYHPTYYNYYEMINKKKLIVTVHDMIHELYYPLFKNDDTSMKKKKILSKADKIISVSENTKKDLINIFSIPENKIKVIYHGNSLINIVDNGPLHKEPYLLYVGNRGFYKNFMRLLESYARLKYNRDISLVCFGGGKFNNKEKNFILKMKLEKKVKLYMGDDAILSNLYRYAKAFIYPSLYEGFGIPLLEAMHYQCPIVASNSSSIPEILCDAGLYFNPNSVEDICIKIEKILEDDKLKNILCANGNEREKNFSWDKCAEQTYELYEEV